MGKVILSASGKGGTGKTMFASNLGATYALAGYSVVILDMDMGLRNMDLYFGLENKMIYDAYDVMTGRCRIKQALIRDNRFPRLFVMGSSPVKEPGNITPLHVKVLVEKLSANFDYVIVDAPSGIGDGLVMASAGSDIAVVVSTPEYASLRDSGNMDAELKRLGVRKRYLVLNKMIAEMMNAGYIPHIREIVRSSPMELIGIIMYDRNINISTNLGVPIVLKQNSYISDNFRNIAGFLERA
ncbi:MAG: septum site-determining protein MinD [Anaerovoracaceae bacterium]|jgi:septum site-determining protein MinD